MKGWSVHSGKAVSLRLDNIDTDQLIPARFMSQPRAAGYGPYLLHDLRYDADGEIIPDFILNQISHATVLISGQNFGTGSSREAAVYALVDAGIQAVVASGFGDIFAANAVNNGLLPAQVEQQELSRLHALMQEGAVSSVIDLTTATLTIDSYTVPFSLDDAWRAKLINGWDDIDLSLAHTTSIHAFRTQRYRVHNWALPASKQDD